MIQLQAVSKFYAGQHCVLNEVNVELAQGEFLYLLGGSGTGKSSLLRLISAQERPTAGIVRLFGYDLSRVSGSTLRTIQQSMGFVPQGFGLIPDLSVEENIHLGLATAGARARANHSAKDTTDELMGQLRLLDKRHVRADHLSGGEAQRVALARALIRAPALILADEPTGAQDRDMAWTVMELLSRAHAGGATVLVATHDREIVRRLRRRSATLKGGRLHVEEGGAFAVAEARP